MKCKLNRLKLQCIYVILASFYTVIVDSMTSDYNYSKFCIHNYISQTLIIASCDECIYMMHT